MQQNGIHESKVRSRRGQKLLDKVKKVMKLKVLNSTQIEATDFGDDYLPESSSETAHTRGEKKLNLRP